MARTNNDDIKKKKSMSFSVICLKCANLFEKVSIPFQYVQVLSH